MAANRCLLKSSLIIFLLSAAPLIARASLTDTVTFSVLGADSGQFVANVEANGLIQMSDLISFTLQFNAPPAPSVTLNPATSVYTLSGFGTFNTLTDLWSPNGAGWINQGGSNNAWFTYGNSQAWLTANSLFDKFAFSYNTVNCGLTGSGCDLAYSQSLQDGPTPQAPEFPALPTAQTMVLLASCLLALWAGGKKAQFG